MLSFGSLPPRSPQISNVPLVKVVELICVATSWLAAKSTRISGAFCCGDRFGMRDHMCVRVVLKFSKGKKNTFQIISVLDSTIHLLHFQYELGQVRFVYVLTQFSLSNYTCQSDFQHNTVCSIFHTCFVGNY